MMFKKLPIPRLSKINSAVIKLQLADDGQGYKNAQIKIFAKTTGDSYYLSNCLHNDTSKLGDFVTFRLGRMPRAKEIIWTPDISGILQKRVNDVSYAPGTALVVVLAAVKGGSNEAFYLNLLDGTNTPVLELDYTLPSKYASTESFLNRLTAGSFILHVDLTRESATIRT